MLDTLLRATVRIDRRVEGAPPKLEAALIDDDGVEHMLVIHEGRLKEVRGPVEVGRTYRVTFLPFVNNRWVELRITSMEPIDA